MNWGKGIALALALFAGMMGWFMWKAGQNPTPLVTEHYYEEELRYQQRIDESARAEGLPTAVEMTVTTSGIRLVFPKGTGTSGISGRLDLLRPNDPLADISIPVKSDAEGIFEHAALALAPGRCNALLVWVADGRTFYTEQKLVVQ